jgi:hypothetical protein
MTGVRDVRATRICGVIGETSNVIILGAGRTAGRATTRLSFVTGRPSGVIAFNYAQTAGAAGTICAMCIATAIIAGRLPWGSG